MEPKHGDLSGQPPSPEEVAREFIRREGSFEPPDDLRRPIHRRSWVVGVAIVVVVAAAVGAGVYVNKTKTHQSGSDDSPAQTQAVANQLAVRAGCPANPEQRVNDLSFAAPTSVIQPSTLYAATVTTTAGSFRLQLFAMGPQALNSFVFLAQQGYFNCNTFFQVKSRTYDLTGDPTGTGSGGPGYIVNADDPPPAAHPADQYPLGSLVLDNGGTAGNGGSQWFIVTGPQGEALPDRYTLFGRVAVGLSVVEKINAEGSRSGRPKVIERILRVTIQTASS